jgi:hypothetical protein
MEIKLAQSELQSVLATLNKFREQNRRAYEAKRAEAAKIAGELAKIAEAGKGLAAAINSVRQELGMPLEERHDAPASSSGPSRAGETDTTFEVMRIISEHQEQGGIDIDGIEAKLKERGVKVSSRDYLNTILTRKRNKQKKLTRVDGKWLLTDKGKAEVRMKTE